MEYAHAHFNSATKLKHNFHLIRSTARINELNVYYLTTNTVDIQ